MKQYKKPRIDSIMAINDDALLTINEAGDLLGVTGQTVRNRVLDKSIAATYAGHKPYISGKTLKALVTVVHQDAALPTEKVNSVVVRKILNLLERLGYINNPLS